MSNKYDSIVNHIDNFPRDLEVVYTQNKQRKIFMDELKEVRKQRDRRFIKRIIKSIGPSWYHELSEPQRRALDTLEFSIYQDVLAGRPQKTDYVIRQLGLYPLPHTDDLMHCVYMGRKDPKQLLAHLFGITFGHSIEGKRADYNLNAKLLLSGILYLGLDNLIALLREKFHMDPEESVEPKPEVKPKPILKSPYLEEMVAVLYQRPKPKLFRPAPLPLLELSEPYEEEPLIRKPPPLPPPPPPPKKKLPRSYCDKLADVRTIQPQASDTNVSMKPLANVAQRRRRSSKMSIMEDRSKSFRSQMSPPKKVRRRKPVAPSTGMSNAQYLIQGVFSVHGKTAFVLGSVSILPPDGFMINNGYAYIPGGYINIHGGFCARPPPPKPDPCDCVGKWRESVLKYLEESKCYCDHYYDYGNEGAFLPDELPFFEKPTRHETFRFNYQTIYDLDPKHLQVQKEFKRIWETDSMLRVDGPDKKDPKAKHKAKKHSTVCLRGNLNPEEYLKNALRAFRRVNIAARLPDIHLVPVLREWMRYRIQGPYTRKERTNMLNRSIQDWLKFWSYSLKEYDHVSPPKEPKYSGETNWAHKYELTASFRTYIRKYRLELFKSYAKFNNMWWPTMCQAEFPDKKFREIFFSYLYSRVDDLSLLHPYSVKETAARKNILRNKRYSCLKNLERLE